MWNLGIDLIVPVFFLALSNNLNILQHIRFSVVAKILSEQGCACKGESGSWLWLIDSMLKYTPALAPA